MGSVSLVEYGIHDPVILNLEYCLLDFIRWEGGSLSTKVCLLSLYDSGGVKHITLWL